MKRQQVYVVIIATLGDPQLYQKYRSSFKKITSKVFKSRWTTVEP